MSQPGTVEFVDQINRAADLVGGGYGSIGMFVSPTMEVGVGAGLPTAKFQRFAQSFNVIGDATHTGLFALINPPNSQMWIVVEGAAFLDTTAAAKAQLLLLGAPGGFAGYGSPITTGVHLDRRFGINIGQALLNPTGASTIATGDIVEAVQTPVNTMYDFRSMPVLLVPDSAIVISPSVATHNWYGYFRWRLHEIRPT